MSKTNETKNDAALPLWRVSYTYVVKYQLRSGTYIVPANNTEEAKAIAQKLLSERFADTGPYKVTHAKPF